MLNCYTLFTYLLTYSIVVSPLDRIFISQPALRPLRTLRATVLHCICTSVNFDRYLECCDFSLQATTLIKSESGPSFFPEASSKQ